MEEDTPGMTGPIFAPSVAAATIFAFAGLGFGFAYFAALRRSLDYYTAGQGRFMPAALTFGRFAAAALFFAFMARVGGTPLLMAFIGFLLARALALRAVRSAG
jgi:voltage-gated potassium channel Kch